ncbi:ornithine carbamoyltransferase [Calorimonas adulescens]|jgi:ornithine carbamoyltransferase|uniref:Ornithine carbamoyltransferase n=1 Tax=Calorimonas adulescens TaxID=2606906 RepID=A0A5D8QEI8_9THEO|nr:ornithine carbamoyltransferase [Calorimonas adulescens]TZE82921.1 ornithine carbamoyltransferase [Calorimonas adulescens]
MPVNMKGKSLLTVEQLTQEEMEYLLDLASTLKAKKKAGIKGNLLEGKNIALLFEKPSTRTRCAFTVACVDEGAHPEYLGKDDIQLGKKETVADTARVLGRMFDGIEFRGFKQETVEQLAKYAGVPVWNGLTDYSHPTQILADFLTIKEHFGYLKGIKLTYMGDARNNMGNSLMMGCAVMGMHFVAGAPKALWPEDSVVAKAKEIAKKTGAIIEFTESPREAVKSSDVVYTDVWASMGEESKLQERINLLKPYQVNMDLIRATEKEDVIFLHCLPAFHNNDTEISENVGEMEVTDEVFESKYSKVFDEAENRMHTIKAIMVATLA